MWKRVLVVIIALVGTFSAVFVMNGDFIVNDLQAAPVASTPYYGIKEKFERTGGDYTVFGNQAWVLIYADQVQGIGYFISAESASKKYGCPITVEAPGTGAMYATNIPICKDIAYAGYSLKESEMDYTAIHLNKISGNHDQMSYIADSGAINQWLTVEQYNIMAKGNDASSESIALMNSIINNQPMFLNSTVNDKQVAYWTGRNQTCATAGIAGTTNLLTVPCDGWPTFQGQMYPVMTLKLPKKGIIKSISSTQMDTVKDYNTSGNSKDSVITNINTAEGVGPYKFYVYDTDKDGNGNHELSSFFFNAKSSGVNGSATSITIKDEQLPVGDYYFRVAVVDESTDERLYYSPDNMSLDPFRRKDTGVIHVKVNKANQPSLKVFESTNDKTNDINEKTMIYVDSSKNSVSLYPEGGAEENPDTFTFTTISDPNAILADSPIQGNSGLYNLTHKNGTAIVEIRKSGGDNYNDVVTRVTITTSSLDYTSKLSSDVTYGSDEIKGDAVIGTVKFANGTVPITYELAPSSTDTTSYELFKMSNADIIIDATKNPSGLETGTYRFLINAKDSKNFLVSKEVVLTVNKAESNLQFSSADDVYRKIGDNLAEYEITSKNTDSDYSPQLSVTGGIGGLLSLSINPSDKSRFTVSTAETYSGDDLPIAYSVKITSAGTKNFKPGESTTKTFYLYKGLSGIDFEPVKETFSVKDLETIGTKIGTVVAQDGYPNYTYEILKSDHPSYENDKGLDYALFALSTTTAGKGISIDLVTATKLQSKTYHIQLGVTDESGDQFVQDVTVQVVNNDQLPLKFKDKEGGSDIESLTLPYIYPDSLIKAKLVAEGGSGNGTIIYKLSPEQPDGVTASDIVSIDESTGNITMMQTGKVNVMAEKDGGSDYNKKSVMMLLTIEDGIQTIDFDENTLSNVLLSERSFTIHASVTREDGSTPRAINYTSTTPSVCEVNTTSGLVTLKTSGTCSIKAANNDEYYKQVDKIVNIEIYDDLNSVFEQILSPVPVGTINTRTIARMKDTTGGDNSYSYHINNASSLLKVSELDGMITLKDALKLSDLSGKWDVEKGNYIIHETIIVKDGSNHELEKEITIVCAGKELQASFENAMDGIIHVPFTGVGNNYSLTIKNNLSGGSVSYTIEENPSNLIDSSITQSGLITQKKASADENDYATIKAVIAPKDGYAGQEITVKIIIDKATQTVAFDTGTPSKVAFKEDETFSVLATSSPAGADITYEASPAATCTISGNTVTMKEQGTCTAKAIAKKTNYEDAEVTKEILFYQGLDGNFVLTHNSLEAKGNDDSTIGTVPILVGYMDVSGGTSETTQYALSTNTGDKNLAQSLFTVSDDDVFLKHELKAEDLERYATYDAINHVYLLKIQVDVTNGSDKKTVDCEIKIKGAPLKNLSFMDSTNNIITKVYTKNDADKIFDLGVSGNEGSGTVTYSLKTGSDVADGAITLSGTGNKKATIVHADDKDTIVIADITQSKGYAKTQVEAKIKVNKANQDNFELAADKQNVSIDLGGEFNLSLPANDSGETVVFESDPSDVVEVLADAQTLRALKVGSSVVTIKSPGNQNYNEKILTVNVQVYGALKGEIKQTDVQILQADNTAIKNKVVGTFTIKDGQSAMADMTVLFPEGNSHLTLIDISTTSNPGAYELRLNNPVTAFDIANCAYDTVNDVYLIPVKISVTDPALPEGEKTIEVSSNIKIKGAEMENDIDFADAQDGVISKVYSPGGEIALSLVEKVYIDPTTVTYRRKSDLASGVVTIGKVGSDYIAYIDGASQEGDPKVYIEATIPSQKGYQGRIIETEVSITKAEQNFDFANIPTKIKVGKTESLTFTSIPKGNNGAVILESDSDKVTITNGRTPKITAVTKGENIKISATAKGNENYNDKVVDRYIEAYSSASLLFDPTSPYPQANSVSSEANNPAGTFSSENGTGNVQIELEDVANFADNTHFQITNAGTLSFRTNITADILKNYPWNETEKAYEMPVKFKLTDNGDITYVTESLFVKGASLNNISFKDKEGNATDTILRSYADKQFMLELTGKVENTWPYGEVSYSLEVENSSESDGSSSIIESIDAVTGITKIRNANLAGSNEVANAKASIKAAYGYDEQEVKAKIIINKANQPDFKFGSSNYSMELNDGGLSVILLNKLSGGSLTYDIVDESKVSYDEESDMFKPLALGSTIVTATTDTNDRNYNVAQAQTTIQVIQGAADVLMIQIDQGSTVTYGDTGITASIKNSTVTGSVTGQTWNSSNAEVATIDETTGAITIHGRGQADITLTQEIEGRTEKVTSVPVMLNVKRKVLYVTISDAEKLVGEDMPSFEIEQVTGLVGTDTFTSKSTSFICLDAGDNLVNSYTGVGEYEIKGNFSESDNPNYILKVDNGATSTVTNGILRVKQDGSDPSWYKVRSDASPTDEGWYSKDVFLDLNLVEGQEYDVISDKIDGAYDVSIPVQVDGIHDKDIYFKASRNNAIATPQAETIRVDQSKPKITSVAGKTINDDTTARVLNALTLDLFFKPGSEITIYAVDNAPQTDIESSGIANIAYEVYSEIPDENGNTLIKEGSVTSDQAAFTIDGLGEYIICAVATDNAGNESPQACQKAMISKIDVDVDGDNKPDFNDPSEDGCPDLNIKWKDPNDSTKWIVINGDRNYDGIPDLNIDSDGDGKVDLNIDTDGDNSPDVNLVILKKSDWIPSKCVNTEVEEYCTGTSVKPLINVDTDLEDGKIEPELDIDTTGDMKADLNISKNGVAAINIAIHKDWEPKKDLGFKGFTYDSDNTLIRYLNIDTTGDGIPDVNVDINDDGIADLNIDTDGDEIPDVDIDSDGDSERDINIDDDGDGSADREIMDIPEWKPDNKVDVNEDMSYGTITIKRNEYLKDEGFVMRNGSGNKFLPIYALKVVDITSDKLTSLQNYAFAGAEEREPIAVYEMSLLRNEETVPLFDDALIQVPVDEEIKNPKFYLQDEEKDVFTPIDVVQEDGFYTFTTSSLGELAVLGEIQENDQFLDAKEDIDMSKHIGGGIGGSETGDRTNLWMLISLLMGSGGVLFSLKKRKEIQK